MKNFFFLLFPLIISSCAKQKDHADIELNYDGERAIEIITPIDDIRLWDNKKDTISFNNKNIFYFKKKIESPQVAIIKIGNERMKSLLIPGNNLKVSFIDSSFVFQGKNKEGMQLLNEMKRPTFTVSISQTFKRDTTATQVKNKIDSLKKVELKKLERLIRDNLVEEKLLKILNDEINYFYALRTLQVIISKQNEKFPINNDLIALFDETIEEYPLEIEYKPTSWLEYAEEVLLSKKLYDLRTAGKLNRESIIELYENNKWFEYQFNLISDYKNQNIAEKVAAYNILTSAKQDKFEKSLISVFENFKMTYPNSNYIPYLKPEIDAIREYHQKVAGKMPDGVKFIDGKNFKNIGELITELKGDKYYIDIWATWCGPCKKEFRYNKQLDSLLKKYDYKKILISIDPPSMEEKWKQDIKYYNLKGLNIRATEKFHQDLVENYGVYMIPKYFILDETGGLVDAPRPSNLLELQKTLKR